MEDAIDWMKWQSEIQTIPATPDDGKNHGRKLED